MTPNDQGCKLHGASCTVQVAPVQVTDLVQMKLLNVDLHQVGGRSWIIILRIILYPVHIKHPQSHHGSVCGIDIIPLFGTVEGGVFIIDGTRLAVNG